MGYRGMLPPFSTEIPRGNGVSYSIPIQILYHSAMHVALNFIIALLILALRNGICDSSRYNFACQSTSGALKPAN